MQDLKQEHQISMNINILIFSIDLSGKYVNKKIT